MKIKASKLLLENTQNTFVTPVFNGSASLRDAAGQLIENVTKSIRRGETVDEEYMSELFSDVASLYRLNEGGVLASGKAELGPLPVQSVALLSCIALAWVGIIGYLVYSRIRARKRRLIEDI